MNSPSPPNDDRELLPLLVLAPRPPGSTEPLATHDERDGRHTVLYRSEFGYDCKVDSPNPKQGSKNTYGGRSVFGWVALVCLFAAGALLAFQPSARSAIGGIFAGHRPTPAPTSAPSPTGSVLAAGSDTTSPTPSPVATPPPAAPLVLTGGYSATANGAATTTCPLGTAGPGRCVWTLKHERTGPLHFTVAWTGNSNYALVIAGPQGNQLAGTSGKSPISTSISDAPDQLTATVTFSTDVTSSFTLTTT